MTPVYGRAKRPPVVAHYPDGRRFVFRRVRDSAGRAVWEWAEGKTCTTLLDAVQSATRDGAKVFREKVDR